MRPRTPSHRSLLSLIASLCLAAGFFIVGWSTALASPPVRAHMPMGVSSCYSGVSNAVCETGLGETCSTCPEDCGACSPGGEPGNPCNNDKICDPGEEPISCGDCIGGCGDGLCKAEEVSTCALDCTVEKTCGDGLCTEFESFSICPLDCDPPSRTPAATPTLTRTPAVRASDTPPPTTPPTRQPSRTPAGSDPTLTPLSVILGTQTPTRGPAPTSTRTSAGAAPECRILSATAIDGEVVETFVKQTEGYTAPAWMLCDAPPSEVCLPPDPLLGVSAENFAQFILLDCTDDRCRTLPATSFSGGELCFTEVASIRPTCTGGCAFAPAPLQSATRLSPIIVLIPFVIVVIVLGAASRLLVWFFVRRRDAGDEDSENPGIDEPGLTST